MDVCQNFNFFFLAPFFDLLNILRLFALVPLVFDAFTKCKGLFPDNNVTPLISINNGDCTILICSALEYLADRFKFVDPLPEYCTF